MCDAQILKYEASSCEKLVKLWLRKLHEPHVLARIQDLGAASAIRRCDHNYHKSITLFD